MTEGSIQEFPISVATCDCRNQTFMVQSNGTIVFYHCDAVQDMEITRWLKNIPLPPDPAHMREPEPGEFLRFDVGPAVRARFIARLKDYQEQVMISVLHDGQIRFYHEGIDFNEDGKIEWLRDCLMLLCSRISRSGLTEREETDDADC